MNQIWFGLIWITPKESKTKEKTKKQNKQKQRNRKKNKHVFQTSLNMPRSK